MGFLDFIKQIGKSDLFEKKSKENILIVEPAFNQILNKLESISKDNTNYYWIITEMKNHLNHKEVELLVDLTGNFSDKDIFLSALEEEKYFWGNKIEFEYFKDVENAKLSLCTSDYLAFIIGKKYDLHQFINKGSFWNQYYKNLDLDLNTELLKGLTLLDLESSQKAHIPVNYALSMFLLYDKKEAKNKLSTILTDDINYRLEASYQAEYFLIYEHFFDRLKLDFIPKINFKNHLKPIDFKNVNDQYITKEELKKIIDSKDYFNRRPFDIDFKKILNENNCTNTKLLVECYFAFFEFYGKDAEYKNIEILISCFTEKNSKYSIHEISLAKTILNDLVITTKMSKQLIYYSYYLISSKVIKDSKVKLAHLLSNFFNKEKAIGMSNSTIIDVFTKRTVEKVIFHDFLDKNLLERTNEIISKHNSTN